jgi:hypothetical protein
MPQLLYDLGELIEISRGNDAFVKKMVRIFSDRITPALKDLKDAYDQANYKTVRDIAHLLKPGIDNMRILSIKTVVRTIEHLALNDPASPLLAENINTLESVLSKVQHQLQEELK